MTEILFKSAPTVKEELTLALEAGVDGLVVPHDSLDSALGLARCDVVAAEDLPVFAIINKESEEEAIRRYKSGERLIIGRGAEIIPLENILAALPDTKVYMEAGSLAEAELAAGILERGVQVVVLTPEALPDIRQIVSRLKTGKGEFSLQTAEITAIRQAGLGHRVCIDTISILKRGQGMLVGNSSAFSFLVHAETEYNAYVAARPFRVNAGAVQSYAFMPGDKTRYLEEIRCGDEVLIVSADGSAHAATVGRVKTEIRPMLLIEARIGEIRGTVFLQNAETIRLTRPDGVPVSVVALKEGDEVLCHTDAAGRHFGMRINENIMEI